MDKITKTYIGEIKSIDEKNFTVEAVVSDETIDRYQEVIKIDAWKKGLKTYQQHGVLLSSHNYGKLTNQIGIAEKIRVDDGKLIAKFKYFVNAGNEEADWGFFLAKQGLAAYSVGFLPRPNGYETADWDDADVKSGKKPLRTYTDVELLEVSQVTVPANPSALQKSMDDMKEDEDPVIKEFSEMVYQKLFTKQEEIPVIEDSLDDEVITKPDTENYVHIGVDEGNHTDHKIRTITLSASEGIKAHYCVDCKKNTGYLFDKTKGWTHEKAAKWVEDHSKAFDMAVVSDVSLIDENKDLPVIVELTFEELDSYLEEEKKKPKGGCKSEEEEEMILKAIEDLKTDIFAKFTEIEERFAKWEKEDEEYQKDLEAFSKELEEQEKVETEDIEKKQLEEENYIKVYLSEMNEMLATKFSVQSE